MTQIEISTPARRINGDFSAAVEVAWLKEHGPLYAKTLQEWLAGRGESLPGVSLGDDMPSLDFTHAGYQVIYGMGVAEMTSGGVSFPWLWVFPPDAQDVATLFKLTFGGR